MAREIEINTSSLDRDIQAMEVKLQSLHNSMDKMYDAVIALDRTWDGPANEVFVQQFNSDRQAMLELLEILNKLKEHMQFASKEYDTCEKQVGDIVSSIRI